MEAVSVKTEPPWDDAAGLAPPGLHAAEVTSLAAPVGAEATNMCPERVQLKREGIHVKQEVIDPQEDNVDVKQEVMDLQVDVDPVVKKESGWEVTTELKPFNVLTEDIRVELELEFEVPGGSGTAHTSKREMQQVKPEPQGFLVPRFNNRGRRPVAPAPPRDALLTSGPLFSCDTCARSYKCLVNLEKHMTTHTGEKPFACDLCEWRFAKLNDLKRHYRTHRGDVRFKWKTLHNKFLRLSGSTKHVGVTAAYPYSCGTCDRSFSERGDLKTHEWTHSREFVCGACGTRLSRLCDLHTHVRAHCDRRPREGTT